MANNRPSSKRQSAPNGPWLPLSSALEWKRVEKDDSGLVNRFRQRKVPKLLCEYLLGQNNEVGSYHFPVTIPLSAGSS